MKFRPVKSIGLIATFVFLTLASATITPLSARADIFADWVLYDKHSEGYFSNSGESDTYAANAKKCGYDRCPVIPNDNYARDSLDGVYFRGGNVDTAASVERAKRLVSDLKTIYSWGGWNSSGSAFIVNTMLGYGSDNPNKTRTPSPAMWDEVENRLVDRAERGLINWNLDFSSNGRDTFTRIIKGQWDVVYNTTPETRNGIIIYNDAGVEAYRIWYSCANPVGVFDGIPAVTSYSLTPTITGSPAVIDSGGQDITLVPTISNANSGESKKAEWQLTKFVVPPASPPSSIPGAATNATVPTNYYGYGAQTVDTGSDTFNSTSPPLSVSPQPAGDYPVGTRVCFALSVSPYSQSSSTNWSHSEPFCALVAKKPKVQILGSDLVVGRETPYNLPRDSQVATSKSFSSETNRHYGSWSEYAIIPTGRVSGMASGATYSGGTTEENFCKLSVLTIANNTNPNCQVGEIGKYISGSVAPDVASRFPTNSAQTITTSGKDINTLPPSLVYTSNLTNLTLTSSAVFGSGRWVVINAPTTTVTINSDINYTNASLGGISDIPQVVIIAKNIIIADSVTNIDAWLFSVGTGAEGIINTCGAGGVTKDTLPTSKQCTKKLTVNGPLLANHLVMRRTAGAGTGASTGDPAEVFNLRGDAYLWASAYSSSEGRLLTVSTKELPPRF